MKKIEGWFFVLMAISLVFSGCNRTRGDDSSGSSMLQTIAFNEAILVGNPQGHPADPFLATSGAGEVFVSWTEESSGEEGRDGFIAKVKGGGQQLAEIRQMNQEPISGHGGENLAKFALAPDGGVAAIWSAVSHVHHAGTLKAVYSEVSGSFTPEGPLNDDQRVTNHGFTGIATGPDGRIYASWLDGRNDEEAAEVFMAVSEDGGKSFGKNFQVSTFACPCCRPTIAFLDGGETMIVAHRRFATSSGYIVSDNVRDHQLIRSTDGGKTFSDPVLISDDGWVTYGCPHAGIALDVDGQDMIHAVWWTGGRTPDEAGIYYAYSEDGGKSFAPRQLMVHAPHDTVLHTHITVDKNDTLYASWINIEENRPQIFLAHRSAVTGQWSPIHRVSDGAWNTVYPVVTVDEENLYVAWTERKGEDSQVRLRTAPLVEN